jgi:hypothetical protein
MDREGRPVCPRTDHGPSKGPDFFAKAFHPLGGRRATIKAHPATLHHPRPYGRVDGHWGDNSPGRMESLCKPEVVVTNRE